MPGTDPIAPKPRRFSIRLPRPLWIGLATVVLIVVAAGLRIGVPIYRQQAVIREIERLGGTMSFRRVGPEWLRQGIGEARMKLFDAVESVNLPPDEETFNRRFSGRYGGRAPYTTGPAIDDATLACVTRLPGLSRLNLRWTNTGDTGMEHVSRLQNLEELSLEGTDVSDRGARFFAKLSNLKSLDLTGSKVTAAALVHLNGLENLETLSLDDTQLTPAGIRQLSALPRLKTVRLRQNLQASVHKALVDELRRTSPRVDVK